MNYDDDDPYSSESYYGAESEDYYGIHNGYSVEDEFDMMSGDIYSGTTLASSQSQISNLLSQGDAYDQQSTDGYTVASTAASQGSKRAVMVCPTCGGTDFHEASSDGLGDAVNIICSQCFTQTQAEVGASETDFDTAAKMASRSRGRIKVSSRVKREKSGSYLGVEIPSAEVCLQGFQHLLIGFAKIGAKLSSTVICNNSVEDFSEGSQKEFETLVIETCGKFYFGWLRQWHKAATYYSNIYPECRLSIREAFLNSSVARALLRSVENQINDELENSSNHDSDINHKSCQSFKADDDVENDDNPSEKDYQKHNNNRDEATSKHQRIKLFSIESLLNLISRETTSRKSSKSLTAFECALRCMPSHDFLMACLLCTFSSLRLGITATTICEWCVDGRLPYLDSYYLLPENMRVKLFSIRGFFVPSNLPNSGNLTYLSELLRICCLEFIPSLKQVSMNVPLIAARLISDIGLNQTVLDYTFSLMGCHELLNECKTSKLPVSLLSAKAENITSVIQIGAVVVVACRLVQGWEYQKYGFDFENPTSCTTQRSRFIPWDLMMLSQMKNGTLTNDYLSFLDEHFVKRFRDKETSACKEPQKPWTSKSIFADDKLSEFVEWLIAEGTSSSINNDYVSSATSQSSDLKLEPSYVLAEPGLVHSSTNTFGSSGLSRINDDVNAVGKYVVYKDKKAGKYPPVWESYLSPRSYHPHYSLLVEFISDKLGVEAYDLHRLVNHLDHELLEISKKVRTREKR